MRTIKYINFFIPHEKSIAGGIKRIISHANIINTLNCGLEARLIFIKKKSTSKWISSIKKKIKIKTKYSGWKTYEIKAVDTYNQNYQFLNSKTKIKKNLKFNKDLDFIIFPEIFAHFAEDICIKKKIRYAIVVLNNFSFFSTNNSIKLKNSYDKSKFIISGSKSITKYLNFFFINKKKIFQSIPSIDNKFYSKKSKKMNIITYMPRKLKKESDLLFLYLKKNIPKNWKIKPIHNMSEKDVIINLNKSKIFLSFSDFEGFGRPPLEAAIAGNKVIGYHGEGGKEYMKKPLFINIERGNILKFANEIILNTKKKLSSKSHQVQIKKLVKKYSKKNEIKSVEKYLNFIKKY